MKVSEQIEFDSIPEENGAVSHELHAAKLRKIGISRFQFELKNEIDFLHKVKESSRFFHLNLPSQLDEFFIRFEEAPLFWMYDSPLSVYVEEQMKLKFSKNNGRDYQKVIKDYYTKWITTTTRTEKKYFANTVINMIERNVQKSNFFNQILLAVIYTFEQPFFDGPKAIQLLEGARDTVNVSELNPQFSQELFYLISLYSGFVYLKMKDYSNAQIKFSEAIAGKPSGITAKFYSAMCEFYMNDVDVVITEMKEIYDYDISRLAFAISIYSFPVYQFFIKNPVIENLFYYPEFAPVGLSLDSIFHAADESSELYIHTIKEKLDRFRSLEIDPFHLAKVEKQVVFIEKVLMSYAGSKNNLFHSSLQILQENLLSLFTAMQNSIKERIFQEIQDKLSVYDVETENHNNSIKQLNVEITESKNKNKEGMETKIRQLEESVAANIADIEAKVNDMGAIKNFNPEISFKNSMTYNVILSILVLLVGGFAGYTNSYISEAAEFKNVVTILIYSGAKWGVITFVIGSIISIFIAASTALERSNYKQKLIQRISELKNYKEQETIQTRKDYEAREKYMLETLNERIEAHQLRIKEIQNEKREREGELVAISEDRIQAETAPITQLLD